jgi:uncharacterized protein (TIGR03083 family)
MTNEQDLNSAQTKLPVAPAHIREAVLIEVATVSDFVHRVSDADWTKPSAAAEWSIGDVVAHLNLALGLYNRLLGAALLGRGSGSAWKAFGQFTKKVAPVAAPAFNAINSAVPRVMSGTLKPDTLKGQFASAAHGFREKVDKVGPADYTRPIHYMGGPWPLSFFLAAIENELAVHGWDMTSRLDPQAHLSEGARSVLPWFYWGATSFMFRPPAGLSGTIQVSLSDPTTVMWWKLGTGGVEQGVGEAPQPDVTLTGECGTFVLALAGRIKQEDALRATSLSASGDLSLARVFLASWRIT